MERIVTKIEAVKGQKKRKLFVNDSFLCSLYQAEVREYGFAEGEVLDELQYERFCENVLLPRAKKRTLNLILAKDRSRKELEGQLEKDGYPLEIVEAAIDYAESYHYVDDLRVATTLVRSLNHSKSKQQIMFKLKEKGIAGDLIERAFDVIEEEERELQGDEYESAEYTAIRKWIRKKTLDFSSLTDQEKQKIMNSLYMKGFRSGDIRCVINKIESEEKGRG